MMDPDLSNDDKYQKLMEYYKRTRRDPKRRDRASQVLKAAQQMDIDGLVSEDVVTAWRYL